MGETLRLGEPAGDGACYLGGLGCVRAEAAIDHESHVAGFLSWQVAGEHNRQSGTARFSYRPRARLGDNARGDAHVVAHSRREAHDGHVQVRAPVARLQLLAQLLVLATHDRHLRRRPTRRPARGIILRELLSHRVDNFAELADPIAAAHEKHRVTVRQQAQLTQHARDGARRRPRRSVCDGTGRRRQDAFGREARSDR